MAPMSAASHGSPYRPDASGAPLHAVSSGASEPPRCAACGEQLALGFGDATETACASCGTRNELPPEHLALREERAREDAAGAAARDVLAARLGRPQGWVARNLAFLSAAGFLVVAASLAGWPLVAAYGVAIAQRLGVHPIDALGGGPYAAAVAGVEVAVLVVASALFFKLSDATEALGEQQALLTAAAAREPGGPRRCRACAAPLDVPRGKRGARCAYCRADSLVSLPPALPRPSGARKLEVLPTPTSLASAAAAVDAARPALLRPMLRAAVAALVLGGLPMCCGRFTSHQRGGRWSSELSGERRGYRAWGEPAVLAPGQPSIVPYCTPPGVRRRERAAPENECGVQVALRRGEALEIALSHVSPRAAVSFYELDDGTSREWPPTSSEELRSSLGTVDRVATFVAPYGGWFVFAVLDARAGLPQAWFDDPQMTWRITRPGR
jgi:DNA-directed RNA polymerase subunit RPC12/RpoP